MQKGKQQHIEELFLKTMCFQDYFTYLIKVTTEHCHIPSKFDPLFRLPKLINVFVQFLQFSVCIFCHCQRTK